MKRCDATRRELLDGRVDREHLAQCAACREFSEEVPQLLADVRQMSPTLTDERAGQVFATLERVIEDSARVGAMARESRPTSETLDAESSQKVFESLKPAIARAVRRGQRRPAARLAFLGSAGALAAAALLVTVWWQRAPAPLVATVERHHGTSQIDGDSIEAGSVIATGPSDWVHIRAERGRVAVMGDSRLELVRLDSQKLRMRLAVGEIVADVDPARSSPRQVEIVTPVGVVSVKGTLFSVTVSADETTVAVQRGEIGLETQEVEHPVRAGQMLMVTSRGLRRAPIQESTAASMRAAWTPVDEYEPEYALEEDDSGTVVRRRKVRRRRAGNGKCRRMLEVGDDTLATMAAVDCYLAAGRTKQAQAIYRRVAEQNRGTLAAENAAYEWGRLLDLHGKPRLARRAFGQYLREYPSGTFTGDAMFRQCAIDIRMKELDRALACLSSFRDAASGHTQRFTESLWLSATILREHVGDCPAAVRMYRAYVTRRGEKSDEAREWIQWCERAEQ